MTVGGWGQILLFIVVLGAVAVPLGNYMARVYTGETVSPVARVRRVERLLYRLLRVDERRGQDWKAYARSLLVFSARRLAGALSGPPHAGHPTGELCRRHDVPLRPMEPDVQHGLVVPDEHELAVLRRRDDVDVFQPDGRSDGAELRVGRGRDRRRGRADPGNRLPQRVEPRQLLAGPRPHDPLRAAADLLRRRAGPRLPGGAGQLRPLRQRNRPDGAVQTIAQGPVASQEAIKLLGTNGGGFFNVNSAHPFENPNGFTNFFEMLLVLAIPAGLVITYGKMVGSRRQGYAILATMFTLFLAGVAVAYAAEAHGVAGAARRRSRHARRAGLDRRQPGGQGAALRDRRVGALRRRHHGDLVRRGEQLDRVVHRPGRGRAVREPLGQRGDLRGRRHGALLDPAVRPAGRVHRWPDGRAHARAAGQEDRGEGDQARLAGAAVHAADGAAVDGAGDGDQRRSRVDLDAGDRAAGILGDVLRVSLPGQQQRLGVRRLHRLHPAVPPGTSAPTVSASPTCSAASR